MNEHVVSFQAALEAAYVDLFATSAEYAFAASRTTPALLAEKMTAGLRNGSAHHVGDGIKRACKAVGIKYTATAIRAYLKEDANG